MAEAPLDGIYMMPYESDVRSECLSWLLRIEFVRRMARSGVCTTRRLFRRDISIYYAHSRCMAGDRYVAGRKEMLDEGKTLSAGNHIPSERLSPIDRPE